MPSVMSQYMLYELARDEYVGCSVCGQGCLGQQFTESVPYLDWRLRERRGAVTLTNG